MLDKPPGETPPNPGETPPSTPPATPPATPPGSETPPAAPTWKNGEAYDPAQADQALTSARAEANKLKRDLAAAEAKVKASEEEKLSESEKLANRVKQLEAEAATAAQTVRAQRVQLVVERTARELEFVSEEAAHRFLDAERVEFDTDTGQPTNVKALLTEVLKSHPYLKGTAATDKPKQIPETPSGSPPGLTPEAAASALEQTRRNYAGAF